MKIILITGISRGIGKALAEKYLAEGHIVIGTSINGKIDFEHENLTVYKLDLSKPRSILKCIKKIIKSGIKIDIMHNNAGALFDDEETHVIVDKLQRTLMVNLIGTIDFTEQIIKTIRDDGHIVNTSSSAGSLTETDMKDALTSHFPFHYPAYKISKAAINMYTRTLAMRLEHEKTGVTVSSVHPGWVKTDMGGNDAPVLPSEAAADIYKLALSKPETGQFWFKGQKYPW
ncbi:MAG: SDR family NAD(P)-dependent oxidoreductase [Candidatus Pacebacteria bacterium]|nr:SDR family NAD(P)-dependent oxidoreductase [Candidatus Paceibacterota bacterium]